MQHAAEEEEKEGEGGAPAEEVADKDEEQGGVEVMERQ